MNATSGAGSATVSSLGTIDSEVAQKFKSFVPSCLRVRDGLGLGASGCKVD